MSDRPGFACRVVLPLAWELLDRAPTSAARESAQWSNAEIVRFLLHEIDVGAALRPAEERLAEALAPIHTKLEMIIEILGRLAYRELALPPRRDVRARASTASPGTRRGRAQGRLLGARQAVLPTRPFLEPIVLYAQIVFCSEPNGQAGCHIQAELEEMPEASAEAFARLAFLAQRRQRAEPASVHPGEADRMIEALSAIAQTLSDLQSPAAGALEHGRALGADPTVSSLAPAVPVRPRSRRRSRARSIGSTARSPPRTTRPRRPLPPAIATSR